MVYGTASEVLGCIFVDFLRLLPQGGLHLTLRSRLAYCGDDNFWSTSEVVKS